MEARRLAANLKSNWQSEATPGPLSINWLLGFLRRCKCLRLSKENYLDVPRVRKNAGHLISPFFKLYTDYVDTYNILPDDIWNLDEAVFKIGDSMTNIQYLDPNNRPIIDSHDTFELVTTLEMISRTGKVGKPFFIYKRVHQMENWFPGTSTKNYDSQTSLSAFIDESIFHEWVSDHFPASEDKWTLLLMDKHLSHKSHRVIATLISKKIIPLYFPSHMINVLQPLDRSCFSNAKILDRKEISHDFHAELSPTKARFFENYMRMGKEAYSSKTIIGGWRKCGLLENDPDVALDEYQKHIHHDIDTPEGSVQGESVIESEVGKNSTPAPQKKREKRKGGLENTVESLLLETNGTLVEESRNLQSEIKRAKRFEARALDLLSITISNLQQCANELAEAKRNNSIE